MVQAAALPPPPTTTTNVAVPTQPDATIDPVVVLLPTHHIAYLSFSYIVASPPGQGTAGCVFLDDSDVVPESSATGQEAAGVGPGPHAAGLHKKGGKFALYLALALRNSYTACHIRRLWTSIA